MANLNSGYGSHGGSDARNGPFSGGNRYDTGPPSHQFASTTSTPYPRGASSANPAYPDQPYGTGGDQRSGFSSRGSYSDATGFGRESSASTLTPRGGAESTNKERRHECQQCGKKFERPSAVTTHMRSHTGEKPFACDYCEKSFSINSNRLRHQKTYHTAIPSAAQDQIRDEEGDFAEDYAPTAPTRALNSSYTSGASTAGRGTFTRDPTAYANPPTYGSAAPVQPDLTTNTDRLGRMDLSGSQSSYGRPSGSAGGGYDGDYRGGGGGGGVAASYMNNHSFDNREYASDAAAAGRPSLYANESFDRDRYMPAEGAVGLNRDRSASGSSYSSSGLSGYASTSATSYGTSPTNYSSPSSYLGAPGMPYDAGSSGRAGTYPGYGSGAAMSNVRGGEGYAGNEHDYPATSANPSLYR